MVQSVQDQDQDQDQDREQNRDRDHDQDQRKQGRKTLIRRASLNLRVEAEGKVV
jgi:hypothetical protein